MQNFRKQSVGLISDLARKHRDVIDRQYKAAVESLDAALSISDASTPEEVRRRSEQLCRKTLDCMREVTELQVREFRDAIAKWTELVHEGRYVSVHVRSVRQHRNCGDSLGRRRRPNEPCSALNQTRGRISMNINWQSGSRDRGGKRHRRGGRPRAGAARSPDKSCLVDRHDKVYEVADSINSTIGRPLTDVKIGDVTNDTFRTQVYDEITARHGVVSICVPAAGITRDALAVSDESRNR